MFSLAYPLTESVDIDNVKYPLNMAFDNILRFDEMLEDVGLSDVEQIEIGLEMLIGVDLDCDFDKKAQIFYLLYEQTIGKGKEKEQAVDIAGNPMPSMENDEESFYSLSEDASYIFASFMQCYGMDLHEQMGVLHWEKFKALLSGLDESTIFKKIIEIRSAKLPTGKGTGEQRKEMIEAKRAYALKGQKIEFDDEEDEEQ